MFKEVAFIKKICRKLGRGVRDGINRKRLKNPYCTIFCSNCNAGMMYHDLNIKMMSPTINLYILPRDFVRFMNNLQFYLNVELQEDIEMTKEKGFPVGQLNDIHVFFVHYDSFEQAREKWNERKGRVDLDNYCAVMTERDGCTYQDLEAFDQLLCTKVVFTNKEYPQIKSAYHIKGYEKEKELGILSDMQGYFGKRGIDQYDYVNMLNNCGK